MRTAIKGVFFMSLLGSSVQITGGVSVGLGGNYGRRRIMGSVVTLQPNRPKGWRLRRVVGLAPGELPKLEQAYGADRVINEHHVQGSSAAVARDAKGAHCGVHRAIAVCRGRRVCGLGI